jgi:hypothetical protein
MKSNIKINSGQTLFEMVFVFAIMALIVVAIVGMATIGIRNGSYSRNKTLADKYANEAYEWLREERDKSWNSFINYAPVVDVESRYCMPTVPALGELLNSEECEDTEFIPGTSLYRDISLLKTDDNTVVLDISVHWTDSKGVHESKLTTTLSNW